MKENPTFMLAQLEKTIGEWNPRAKVQTRCYQAPGKWISYASDSDSESSIGELEQVYSGLGYSARDPWIELDTYFKTGNWAFMFLGASNGCIPASLFAKQYESKVISLTLLSCVPGREQWKITIKVSLLAFRPPQVR